MAGVVHVAAVAILYEALSVKICPVGGTVSCATNTEPHILQLEPSVSPGSEHVGFTASSVSYT